MQTLNEQRHQIMDRYEFGRVQKTMQALNWCWRGETAPPSLWDIQGMASEIMQTAIAEYKEEDKWYRVSTGGFTAWVLQTDQGARLELNFVVAEYHGDHFVD